MNELSPSLLTGKVTQDEECGDADLITHDLNTDLGDELHLKTFDGVFQLSQKRKNRRTTKILLNIQKCLALKEYVEDIERDLKRVKDGEIIEQMYHLGGNVFASIASPYWGVNIRKWERPCKDYDLRPSLFFGVFIKYQHWDEFAAIAMSIGDYIPEINKTERCVLQHDGQLSAIACIECNPERDNIHLL